MFLPLAFCAPRDYPQGRKGADMTETPQQLIARLSGYQGGNYVKAPLRIAICNLHRISTEQAAENKRLREALVESRDEIDHYIRQKYPSDNPVHERYRMRDLLANPARVALAEVKP